ncbi:MAG: DUF2089 domain-containing protein [Candidatus Omnitrophica bacterium]|nr:DUF2089 domain-containing protein [Candidatus Omnitrophota bacterium]
MRIAECPYCKETVDVKKVSCRKCGISLEGDFYSSPVMDLSEDQQNFVELFMLSSGSLKEMAKILGVTYPTVRNRLDEVIAALRQAIAKREEYKNDVLDKVSKGKISPEQAATIIRNL